MADRAQRTEPPTQRRLEKARQEGQFPAAREFVSALQFALFVALLGLGGGHWFAAFNESARDLFWRPQATGLTAAAVTRAAWQLSARHLLPLALAGLVMVAGTLAFRFATTRLGVSLKKLTPDLARLSPLARLRELPGQNLAALVQAVVLLPLFGWTVYAIARDQLDLFLCLPLASVESGARAVAGSVMNLFWKAVGLFVVFGSVDLFRQLRRYRRDLSMSKQEIKEEVKEGEGNPQMKARIRRLQRDRARRQMMKEVPSATAVVVNPTHYAVAIRYRVDSMAAPVVVAKARNYLAQRIRQLAVEHQVPIVENPPLAQALYKSVEVGQEIPPHLYRAVAEILAYIFKLMHGRLPG
jgi:flagellar biosynthesis protein FlhB